MAELDELLPTLAGCISQVPAFVARPMLRQAVQQFCQKSYLWQVEQAIELDGTTRFALEIPEGTQVAGIVAAAVQGAALRQGFDYQLGGDEASVELLSRGLTRGQLKLAIAIKPDRKSELVGDVLLNHYSLEIAAGAASFLGVNEKMPWTLSKGQVRDYRDQFELGYQTARKRALNHASRLYEAPTQHEFY